MVQDDFSEIKEIVDMIRVNVEFVNKIDGRHLLFAEIVQQLQLTRKMLIYNYKKMWNSTYEMLACVLSFKKFFQEPNYY